MLQVDINKRLFHFELEAKFVLQSQIMVLVGKSGSGKTSLLNCIAGIIQPDSGNILLNEQTFFSSAGSLPIQRRKIGYLFQDYALFPHMTVGKNIIYGMKDEKLTRRLMKELQIEHLEEYYPHEISGGEKQRVALVRALATEPRLLMLDEPFAALDDDTRDLAHQQLLELHTQWKIPIILVTHSKREAEKLGDVIYTMEDGKLVI
ncbi:ATP-binding cassette domain-containing protein [Oceanobacillus luteolus]|uniref:ATP-binding cassette domain-containing protein n=1 Tax=Oceanobacillus luteolus TaxID=1274358 RepID=A0ABW4HPW9_9BACI|nr:ATP-binding cassette domain-containing protein [Oceanobacillus luteolus]MCM3740416.1 ATP-binding cassette domain-containing protein [Oceanobacillus luteolus]